MPLPTMTGTGRLTADPELNFTPNGHAVCKIRLAFNSRRLNNQTQQWEDGDVFYVDGTAWQALAENCAETLAKGMEVTVTGEFRTDNWEKDGQKHSRAILLIRSIGPSLAYATAKVAKTDRTSNQQQPQPTQRQQQHRQQPQNDPWATNHQQPAQNQGWTTEPPF